MAQITRITASTRLNFELILLMLVEWRVVRREEIRKCCKAQAIVVSVPIETVEAALRKYLGSADYPYTNFQLETREEWSSVSQVPQL